jgi:isoleucyl-tRNA synthetase
VFSRSSQGDVYVKEGQNVSETVEESGMRSSKKAADVISPQTVIKSNVVDIYRVFLNYI